MRALNCCPVNEPVNEIEIRQSIGLLTYPMVTSKAFLS
ncbi:MAG: hypothetical protein N838_21890 [Thiohalocapsa sp. PB-PSB1]|jgi:hypothetical protein|nr:MAG: hypothetical protein N838_21890 [Thiohalocapsa sp. PB-PSB1]